MFDFDEKLLSEVPVVVLDTETTGLHTALGHRIIEIGALRLEEGKELETYQTMLNPGRPIEPKASQITGITNRDVQDAPTFKEIVDSLNPFLDGALLVAHNANFDADFLGHEYNLIRQTLENPWLCTLQLARKHFFFGRNSLAHIAAKLNIPMTKAHRALNDVMVTAEVFRRMNKTLADKQKFKTVGDLLFAQGGAIYSPQRSEVQLPPLIADAMAAQSDLTIKYVSEVGTVNSRRITPRYATQHQATTYLIAYCHLRQQQRTFRVDRIMGAEPIS
ncbi:MAG: exonuclease domain-containing protein [Chloroflexota bacterium]